MAVVLGELRIWECRLERPGLKSCLPAGQSGLSVSSRCAELTSRTAVAVGFSLSASSCLASLDILLHLNGEGMEWEALFFVRQLPAKAGWNRSWRQLHYITWIAWQWRGHLLLVRRPTTASIYKWSVKDIPTGIYYYQATGNQTILAKGKLVVQH